MCLPFKFDQGDSLVVIKEERLSLSVNTKPIDCYIFCSVSLKQRQTMIQKFRVNVSRANIELLSNLFRSYAAVA